MQSSVWVNTYIIIVAASCAESDSRQQSAFEMKQRRQPYQQQSEWSNSRMTESPNRKGNKRKWKSRKRFTTIKYFAVVVGGYIAIAADVIIRSVDAAVMLCLLKMELLLGYPRRRNIKNWCKTRERRSRISRGQRKIIIFIIMNTELREAVIFIFLWIMTSYKCCEWPNTN